MSKILVVTKKDTTKWRCEDMKTFDHIKLLISCLHPTSILHLVNAVGRTHLTEIADVWVHLLDFMQQCTFNDAHFRETDPQISPVSHVFLAMHDSTWLPTNWVSVSNVRTRHCWSLTTTWAWTMRPTVFCSVVLDSGNNTWVTSMSQRHWAIEEVRVSRSSPHPVLIRTKSCWVKRQQLQNYKSISGCSQGWTSLTRTRHQWLNDRCQDHVSHVPVACWTF